MMRYTHLEHRFVQHIPAQLEPGVLYVSMEYGTAAHSCCCGCGEEVVTPFTPTDWKVTYDGETVSLRPSIGNWTLACRSHYLIEHSRVIEALPWSDQQITAGRLRDQMAKAAYYEQPKSTALFAPTQPVQPDHLPSKTTQGLLSKISRWAARLSR